MSSRIGIRREDKNEWERRVPLIPTDIATLQSEHGLQFSLQPFGTRAYHDGEYMAVGAKIDEELEGCPIVLGIKEMPIDFFLGGLTYIFFAHVIKGQTYNMPMLRRILELECNLIDYEKIVDDTGRRLVFFGNEAGLAGMIDTLWALGLRLKAQGISSPFLGVRQALEYPRLSVAETALESVGREIAETGVPEEIHPLVLGFAGYGNVSNGAQTILNHLPVIEISPEELLDPPVGLFDSRNSVYKVVFKEQHMVVPRDPAQPFELQDYYKNPDKYSPAFERYIPHLTVLMNCIYWTKRYPRLLTKGFAEDLYRQGVPKLKVIGDISCDVEGAIEVTLRNTNSGNPIFVYDVDSKRAIDGVSGNGPVVLAVDNLPCELPREASARFSNTLRDFIPSLANADFSARFDSLDLIAPLKRALICYHGGLTPDFKYISDFLAQ